MTDELKEPGGPWAVMIGTFGNGFELFGPFETWDAASEWADPMMDVACFFLIQTPQNDPE